MKKILLLILIPIMIIVLLAGAVFAIRNGIIEIIKAVLDFIMDFLRDPLNWVSEAWRHFRNAWNTAFRRRRRHLSSSNK